ncbi:unnamed protein product, partial [Prorocentrum cordatum]
VGSRALAYYDPRDDYWHERIMLAHIQDFRFVVLTADWDIYDEDMSQALRLLPLGPRGGLPVPRPQGHILRVDNARLSAELQQLCDEAAQMALDIREEEGLPAPAAPHGVLADGVAGALAEAPAPAALAAAARPAGPAVGGVAAAGALAAAPAAPHRAPAAGALLAPAPPRPAAPPADAVWLAAETRGGFTAGAPIPPELLGADGQPQVVLGDRGVVALAAGVSLAVAVADTLEAGTAALSSSGGDLRTLPVLYSPAGGRSRSFHDAVAKMSTTPFPDWRIKGPRTAAWLLEKISEAGYTPLQRHFWWRSIQGLTASDSGVDDHHFISEVLQELTTYDQLNAGELVAVEILCRRYQLWEELYASSLREAEAGQDAAPWLDERSIFLGQDRSRGSALVCPALESWVAEKLREESAILKERRKGREERLLERGVDGGAAPGLGASLQGRRGVLNDATSLGFGDDSLAQRDALPIPLSFEALQCLKGFSALDGELSLGQRRKAARCRRQERWVLGGVAALNEPGGGGRLADSGGRLSLAQRSALQHLGEVYAAVPPKTEDCTNQEAFQALLGLRPGNADEPAIGARAGYQRGRVSLPSGGAGRVDLVRLLPPHLQSALESGHGLLRSEQEASAALEEADVTCCVDGKLAQRGFDYGRFLLELYDAGIVEVLDYELDRKEETGVFFVPRKDDKLRLIFDTRRANCHFRTPDYTHLASGDALSSLECTPGEEVHLAAGDVEVCFYQYVLPTWARNYFCLPSLATRMLPARLREALGPEVAARPKIAFRVRVVPMGWNWAVHFVQSAHLNVLASISPNNQWLVDKQPGTCPSDSSAAAKVLCIDNFAAISTSREAALQVVNDMLGSFTSEGVRASLDLDVVLLGFTLGSKAARWRPAPKKFWRVHGCISHLLEPGRRITGRQLERLVGHVVALLLLRREALSLLSAVYVFIRSTYDRAQPLWPSCRRELRWVLALLPTVFADMKRPWHAEVGAFDASPWGAGVCTARWPLSAVQAAGRQPERLRFRGPLASLVAPRDAALAADSIELSDPAALLLGRAAGFAEVSGELLREEVRTLQAAPPFGQPSLPEVGGASPTRKRAVGGGESARIRAQLPPPSAQERARLLPRQGFLAANKVRPSTQVLYLKVLRLLAGWLMVDALPDWPVAAWDAALADFLLWAFDQGVARATAARLGAAVLWGLPQLHVAPLQRCFPQLAHSLAGWKRLHPPGSRPPLPELVVRAAAAWLGHQGEFATALCLMLMFEGYLRPSEALALRAAQLTGPFGSATSAGSHMSVVVHAAELQQPGKTGEMDHTVVLDLPRQQALAWALARLRDSRLGSWHPLWDFDYNLLQRRFGQALAAVGASCLAGTLYSLRHGGASHDRLTASRTLMEVQQRGNWRAFNSVRRYDKHGRVAIEWMKIPAPQRQEIERLAAGLDAACKLYSLQRQGMQSLSGMSCMGKSLISPGLRRGLCCAAGLPAASRPSQARGLSPPWATPLPLFRANSAAWLFPGPRLLTDATINKHVWLAFGCTLATTDLDAYTDQEAQAELRAREEGWQAELAALQSKALAELRARDERAQAELRSREEDWQAELARLQSQVAHELADREGRWREELSRLVAEDQRSAAELEASRGRDRQLQAELEASRGRERQLQGELERADAERVELEASRGRERQLQAELERASAERVELEASRGRELHLQGELGRVAEELATARAEGRGRELAAARAEEQAAARAEELAELRGGLAAAQGEMHEMRVREKMHKALVSQMDAVERQRRLLDDEVGRLSEELRAAREREAGQTERARSEAQGHEELGRQHLQLQSEVAHLRDQLDRRDAEAACLRRELEAQAEERAEETRLTLEELGGLRANVDEQDKRCTEQLRDLEGVRAELRQALGERDALGTELELARKDASAGLAAARAERERHEESLRRQLDGALADAATARAERQAAREELTAAREELTAAHELAAAREAAGNETMTELERARQGLLEARSEASAARAEAQRLGPELEAASAGLEAARAELAAARSEARETAQEGEELRRQLDGALSGGEAIHAELLELRDRVAQHQLLEVELRSHRRREREYQDLQQEVLRKCTQLNAIRNKHVEQASPGPPPVAVAATAVASATTTTEGGVTRMTSTTETRVSACGEAEARVAVEELTPDSHADLGGLAAAR